MEIRERFDPLGFQNGEYGAFQTGHVPHVAPLAYLCTRYAGLTEKEISTAEEEAERYIPQPYREFLSHMNGAWLLGISLHGSIGTSANRSGVGIGQPISIWYQNAVERPEYIPEGHLGIGAINGDYYSQGHLYLASTGEVELYNANGDIIGARWPSLEDFLTQEVTRRFDFYDEAGREIEGSKLLPGDTEEWERLAAIQDSDKQPLSFRKTILNVFRRN